MTEPEPCDCPTFTTYVQCPHVGDDACHHIDCGVFKTGKCNCKRMGMVREMDGAACGGFAGFACDEWPNCIHETSSEDSGS